MKSNPDFDKSFIAKVKKDFEKVEPYWMPKWKKKNGVAAIYCTPEQYAREILAEAHMIADSFVPILHLVRDKDE